jgi:RNA polymerase sigma-32 factor
MTEKKTTTRTQNVRKEDRSAVKSNTTAESLSESSVSRGVKKSNAGASSSEVAQARQPGNKGSLSSRTRSKPTAAKKSNGQSPSRKSNPPHDTIDQVRSVTAELVSEDFEPALSEHEVESQDEWHVETDAAEASEASIDADEIPKNQTSSKALATADPMSLYLASIQKYPLLSREEEQKLATKYYETKDPSAAQALVTANLRFVVKIAAEYSKFGAKLIDLVQEGNVGLMHAVREFNPYKGVRLITYAVWWIRGYIQEYLMRQYSLVRIGTTQNQRKLFYQLKREKESLDALGETPDYKQLAEKLGIPAEEIQEMQSRLYGRDVSLDRPLDDETKATLGDLQKNKDAMMLDEDLALREQLALLKEKIDEIRPELSARELIILDERLLADDPLTLQEIGEKYKITREAVRQMEVRVVNKIKKKFLGNE